MRKIFCDLCGKDSLGIDAFKIEFRRFTNTAKNENQMALIRPLAKQSFPDWCEECCQLFAELIDAFIKERGKNK